MIGINIPGLLATIVAIGPRYAPLTVGAVLCQEIGRLILALSTGSEVNQVWLGGFFSTAQSYGAASPLVGFYGPLWSLLAGVCLGGHTRQSLTFFNPSARHLRPLGVVVLKLALGSALVTLLRMFML